TPPVWFLVRSRARPSCHCVREREICPRSQAVSYGSSQTTLAMRRLLSAAIVVLTAHTAQAQFPPQKLHNLQVFPNDTPVRPLIDPMRIFTRALGVRCPYCHVGNEGEPLSSFDF